MNAACRACGFEMWALNDNREFTAYVCRRCDTSPVGAGYRHGPPKSPGTTDGRFAAPFGDTK